MWLFGRWRLAICVHGICSWTFSAFSGGAAMAFDSASVFTGEAPGAEAFVHVGSSADAPAVFAVPAFWGISACGAGSTGSAIRGAGIGIPPAGRAFGGTVQGTFQAGWGPGTWGLAAATLALAEALTEALAVALAKTGTKGARAGTRAPSGRVHGGAVISRKTFLLVLE